MKNATKFVWSNEHVIYRNPRSPLIELDECNPVPPSHPVCNLCQFGWHLARHTRTLSRRDMSLESAQSTSKFVPLTTAATVTRGFIVCYFCLWVILTHSRQMGGKCQSKWSNIIMHWLPGACVCVWCVMSHLFEHVNFVLKGCVNSDILQHIRNHFLVAESVNEVCWCQQNGIWSTFKLQPIELKNSGVFF